MKKTSLIACAVLASSALTGCYLPEQFNADLTFAKNGTSVFNYDGTIVAFFALGEQESKGKVSEQTDKMARNDEASFKKESDVKSVSYIGDGRYKVSATKNYAPLTKRTDVAGLIEMGPDASGNIVVKGKYTNDLQKIAKSAVYKLDGNISVELPGNAEVVQSNGKASFNFFGLMPTKHQWKIDKANKVTPLLVFRLKS